MIISSAEFVCSNTDYKKCPAEIYPEYAFIGRSNVGKSSLINMLTNTKGLAKTSSTPGKTQLINHFMINKLKAPWYLVDLPGFGYAKISKSKKEKWQQFIQDYLLKRRNLLNIFLLIDSRLEPQKIDLDFMNWLGENELPFCLVFTKTDKLSKGKMNDNIEAYQKRILEDWDEAPQYFITSAEARQGKEEILSFIAEANKLMVTE
jgi:GTP-binding protein